MHLVKVLILTRSSTNFKNICNFRSQLLYSHPTNSIIIINLQLPQHPSHKTPLQSRSEHAQPVGHHSCFRKYFSKILGWFNSVLQQLCSHIIIVYLFMSSFRIENVFRSDTSFQTQCVPINKAFELGIFFPYILELGKNFRDIAQIRINIIKCLIAVHKVLLFKCYSLHHMKNNESFCIKFPT